MTQDITFISAVTWRIKLYVKERMEGKGGKERGQKGRVIGSDPLIF